MQNKKALGLGVVLSILILELGLLRPISAWAASLEIDVNAAHQVTQISLTGDPDMQWSPSVLKPFVGLGQTYPNVALMTTEATEGKDLIFSVSTADPQNYPFHIIYHSCGFASPYTAVLWSGPLSQGNVYDYPANVVSPENCIAPSGMAGVLSIYPVAMPMVYPQGSYILNLNIAN